MRTLLLTVAIALNLAACSTPQERAFRQQANMDATIIEFGPACARLGYTANSDLWRNCVIQLSTRDDFVRYGSSYPYGGWGGRPYWGR
ncbi:hypothetical protein [Massilia sp. PWRC2]|uniref:hypothetical protein n=1 Tax=Massilia sp. PWRC2 TaxID=2804626 RepID=UPI003CE7CE25